MLLLAALHLRRVKRRVKASRLLHLRLQWNMGAGPYDRTSTQLVAGDPGPAVQASVDNPASAGFVIHVPSTGIDTISQAVASWNATANPHAVIQIEDNGTYEEDVTIAFPTVAVPPGQPSPVLILQSANLQRPALIGNITLTGGTGNEDFIMNGLLVAGQLHVQGNLQLLEVVHTTLVPGLGLDEQGQPLQPGLASIIADTPADNLQLLIDHSITGPLLLPEEVVSLTVRDSIIDSAGSAAQGSFMPALVSGSLSPFPALSSVSPEINVTIGDAGPYTAILSSAPANLADVQVALQKAIRAAHPSLAFTAARVVVADDRLIVLPGDDELVIIENAAADTTATELLLDAESARQTSAVISGTLAPFPTITSASPAVTVMSGASGAHVATFAGVPTSLGAAASQLQSAIRAAAAGPGFAGALVGVADDQLVIVSGDGGDPVTFSTAPPDTTTLSQLALDTTRPAIAADDGGDVPGPSASLVRTTIFGEVHVQELQLASEVIFTGRVNSKRRQNGCVRFSFVPEGSQTPRRYRCQPDLEIAQRTDAAERAAALMGSTLSLSDIDSIRDDVYSWLLPSFTDIHYGAPGYAQLLVSCPQQIQTGAEDGSEMGAYDFLKQPQRATSLRVRLQDIPIRAGARLDLCDLAPGGNMSGDYTRWSFDPTKNYSEVFKQQGRVDLDADWNESAEIMDRRWRAETIDIIGPAVYPVSTPDAFLIKPAGPGQFTIGVGRMYVDGLLAECHGLPPNEYDASLGELVGTLPVPFAQQPYYPSPVPLPSAPPATDLIYLDVWHREVTAFEDPSIREKALGGPDTTTRTQTVWQVKILPNVGAHACGDDIPAWNDLIAPSAGRLTTSTVAPTPSPASLRALARRRLSWTGESFVSRGGHVAGTVGGASPAKFKWSRDNGSVVSAADSISAPGGPNSVIKLKSLGRDRVLRFSADDWVEFLDDNLELGDQPRFLPK